MQVTAVACIDGQLLVCKEDGTIESHPVERSLQLPDISEHESQNELSPEVKRHYLYCSSTVRLMFEGVPEQAELLALKQQLRLREQELQQCRSTYQQQLSEAYTMQQLALDNQQEEHRAELQRLLGGGHESLTENEALLKLEASNLEEMWTVRTSCAVSL